MMYIRRLTPNAKLPVRSSIGAAGMDLSSIETITVEPRSRRLVRTGLSIQVMNMSHISFLFKVRSFI